VYEVKHFCLLQSDNCQLYQSKKAVNIPQNNLPAPWHVRERSRSWLKLKRFSSVGAEKIEVTRFTV
jgi:hypothetical protein